MEEVRSVFEKMSDQDLLERSVLMVKQQMPTSVLILPYGIYYPRMDLLIAI